MARDCGLQTVPVAGSMMGLAVGSTLLNSGRVETYPFRLPLSVRDRIAFAKAGLKGAAPAADYGAFLSVAVEPGETTAMPYDDVYAMVTPGRAFDQFLVNQSYAAAVKTACRLVGDTTGLVRAPLLPLGDAATSELTALLQRVTRAKSASGL